MLALALLGALAWLTHATYPYWSALFAPAQTEFSQQNWQVAHHYQRLELAQDFLKKHPAIGMGKDEVVSLLGTPDQQTPRTLSYLLALTMADFMALTFRLDEQGRVIEAFIHQT